MAKEPSSEGSTLLIPELKPGDTVVLEDQPCMVKEAEVVPLVDLKLTPSTCENG